jgi:hypothetical protein
VLDRVQARVHVRRRGLRHVVARSSVTFFERLRITFSMYSSGVMPAQATADHRVVALTTHRNARAHDQ